MCLCSNARWRSTSRHRRGTLAPQPKGISREDLPTMTNCLSREPPTRYLRRARRGPIVPDHPTEERAGGRHGEKLCAVPCGLAPPSRHDRYHGGCPCRGGRRRPADHSWLIPSPHTKQPDEAAVGSAKAAARRAWFPEEAGLMPTTSPDQSLRQHVRAWLSKGLLPRPPADAWAGPGTGRLCVVCTQVTQPSETEYEVGYGATRLFAHLRCYMLWREEAEALPPPRPTPPLHRAG